MDNICTFINYVIRDDIKFENVGNNNILKATFGASSNRPNKNGLWIKHYFVAFGDVAERLRKCGIKAPCFITITCEQTVYKDKKDEIRENYVITDFSLMPKMKSSDSSADAKETVSSDSVLSDNGDSNNRPSVSTPQTQADTTSNLHGLEDLEAEFA